MCADLRNCGAIPRSGRRHVSCFACDCLHDFSGKSEVATRLDVDVRRRSLTRWEAGGLGGRARFQLVAPRAPVGVPSESARPSCTLSRRCARSRGTGRGVSPRRDRARGGAHGGARSCASAPRVHGSVVGTAVVHTAVVHTAIVHTAILGAAFVRAARFCAAGNGPRSILKIGSSAACYFGAGLRSSLMGDLHASLSAASCFEQRSTSPAAWRSSPLCSCNRMTALTSECSLAASS